MLKHTPPGLPLADKVAFKCPVLLPNHRPVPGGNTAGGEKRWVVCDEDKWRGGIGSGNGAKGVKETSTGEETTARTGEGSTLTPPPHGTTNCQ